jgi:hypothetical protein
MYEDGIYISSLYENKEKSVLKLFYLKNQKYYYYMQIIDIVVETIGNPTFLYLLTGITLIIFVKCCK